MSFQVMGLNCASSLIIPKRYLRTVCMDLVIQLYLYNAESEQHPYQKQAKELRQVEIDECFLRNIHHPLIQRVHILCESQAAYIYFQRIASAYKNMKCIFILHGKQPTYAEMLNYVKAAIPSNRIVCIQNSDIYIDHSVSREFLESTMTYNTVVALTRHEHTDDLHSVCDVTTCPLIWDYMGSHDTFLFKTPIPETFSVETLHYPQNVYGGETLFMKAWKDSGKTLFNPSFDIRIFHRHRHRVTFGSYPTIADGYLCHSSPVAPEGRDDIKQALKTLYND